MRFFLNTLGAFLVCTVLKADPDGFISQNGVSIAIPIEPASLNNSDQVVGNPLQGNFAAIWASGSVTFLNPLPGYLSSEADGLNNLGQVVGASRSVSNIVPTLWTNDVPTALGSSQGYTGGFASAINDSGEIAGAQETNISEIATLWINGTPTILGSIPNYSESAAFGLNDLGWAVGDLFDVPQAQRQAVLWQNGSVTVLPGLNGCADNNAFGVNNLGQVVGDSCGHAVVWTIGGTIDLGPGTARGINDNSQVVGTATINQFTSSQAFIWTQATGEVLLAGFIPSEGLSINEAGAIAGTGSTPEPGTFLPTIVGGFVLLVAAKNRTLLLRRRDLEGTEARTNESV